MHAASNFSDFKMLLIFTKRKLEDSQARKGILEGRWSNEAVRSLRTTMICAQSILVRNWVLRVVNYYVQPSLVRDQSLRATNAHVLQNIVHNQALCATKPVQCEVYWKLSMQLISDYSSY